MPRTYYGQHYRKPWDTNTRFNSDFSSSLRGRSGGLGSPPYKPNHSIDAFKPGTPKPAVTLNKKKQLSGLNGNI